MITHTIQKTKAPHDILEKIYAELQLLREEVMFLFPQEDLDEFQNQERIKRSYERALTEHPPVSL